MEVLKEITPLSPEDCFVVMNRSRYGFTYPLHVHPEYELNFLRNASGAIRIVGDSIEEMGDLDLILVGGGTKHAYTNNQCKFEDVQEITLQFNVTIFDSLINKRPFKTIKYLFENARRGVVFSQTAIQNVYPKLKDLAEENGDSFENLLLLIGLLKDLSLDEGARLLNASGNSAGFTGRESDRLDAILLYLQQNSHKSVTLPDVASFINMSEASLNRFLKKWTGKTLIDNLNEIRITNATGRLLDTSDTISEICYKSGFNNLSHFNRIFKKLKGLTPTEYREQHIQTRILI